MSQFQWSFEETRHRFTDVHTARTYDDTLPELKLRRQHGPETEAVTTAIHLQSAKGGYNASVALTTKHSSQRELQQASPPFRKDGWTAGQDHRLNPLS